MKIKILESAKQDLREGFDFYESQETGIGSYFLESLFSDIESLRLSASFFGAPQPFSYALLDSVHVSALGGASLSPDTVIARKGLKPIQDSGALEKLVDEVLAQNPLYSLIGQVMKKTRGKADPAALTKLIQKKLRS
jgi:hypothetical protein